MNPETLLDQYLTELLRVGGSDLHLKPFSQPRLRINGTLRSLRVEPPSPDDTAAFARFAMGEQHWLRFQESKEIDFAYRKSGLGRFRVNAFIQRGTVSLAFRAVSAVPPTAEQLGLPDVVTKLSENHFGLVLVTGPTGSGKSTTLSALVDRINSTRAAHIVTIEDPIEMLHRDKMAIVNQREIGNDTSSFSQALRSSLRQDPDVILVGEMRDIDTVNAALQAAETGHLVLSTLHTVGAAETIVRILDFFPPHLQQQVRISLAGVLRGVVGQRLVKTKDGAGRVAALEILVSNGRIMQCIIEPAKTYDITGIIAEGGYYGMRTFDQSLFTLFEEGKIALSEALEHSSNPHDMRLKMTSAGLIAAT